MEEFSSLRSQGQEEPAEQQKRPREESTLEGEVNSNNTEQKPAGEEHQRQENTALSRDEDTNDEDDEDPQPAKRRKIRTNNNLASSDEPTPVGDDYCSPLHGSRTPSPISESALVAEYREWPFQGFLKRTIVGEETIYNLEFTLPHILEHLHRPICSTVLGTGSSKAMASQRAIKPRKPEKQLTTTQESLLAKLVRPNKSWAEIERHFQGHPLQSLKDNYFGKQGGKPRRRGRKPRMITGGR